MRKIVAGQFITLDGVAEIPEEWMGPYFTPELGQAIGSMMAAQDAMLLGRVTYEMMQAAWRARSASSSAGTLPGSLAWALKPNGTPRVVAAARATAAGWWAK